MTKKGFEALPMKEKFNWAVKNYRHMPKEEFEALSIEEKRMAVMISSMNDSDIAEIEWDIRRREERAESRDRVMIEQIVYESITPAEFEALPEEEQNGMIERAEKVFKKIKEEN